ncbi:hypothetical protein RZN22_09650 [Bacillaceae bacterium S4-13-58]
MRESTLFERPTVAVKPKIYTQKTPTKKTRKTRSDKKHDIKLKLSKEDKQLLKLKAMDHHMSITAFASQVVKQELIREQDSEDKEYPKDGSFVHVVLENGFFEMVKTLSTEWDLSYRKTTHRVVKHYIDRQLGPKIKDWRETNAI